MATVEQDGESGVREQLAILALTVLGERPLTPGFGITDPAFAGFDAGEFAAQATRWQIPAGNLAIDVTPRTDTTQAVTIDFDLAAEAAG